jgi:hypothetical protein
MSFAKLTDNGDGTYGLPVVATFNRPRPFTDAQGIQHAAQIMRLWTPGQLAAIGLARLRESPIGSDERSTGFEDTLDAGVVQRQHTVEPRPVVLPEKPTVISYEEFQDRFSASEFDDLTDFVYETNIATGKPKRKALIQGLSRAVASNSVDLPGVRTIAFMDALVDGDVITEIRKTEILTP